ncbi:hypothetical protein Tco_1193092 [Tanacetum coccineum]
MLSPSHPLILNRPTPLDLSYSGLEEFKQPEVNEYGPKDSSLKPTTGCDKESDNSKENTHDSLKQQQMTDSKTSSVKSPLKVDKDWKEKFFCPANQVREEEPKKARENNDAPIIEDWVSDDEDDVEPISKVEKKTVLPTATKKEFVKPEKPVRRSVRSVNTVRPFSTARSFNIVRPSYTTHPKSTVLCAKPMTHFQNQAQLTVQRPFYKRTTLTKMSNNQNINIGRQTVNTVRQNVNTVRARGFNAVKPSACWVWRPIKPNGASLSNSQLNDKGFVDSGCSRHMSGNIAHLSDFKDFDGGYVTFGGGANGGRITGKGTIKTDKLDFDDVYFVKELKFNLFSVSQMCDKKNYVLFTDSECLVLSPNFKLPDENQILLKIPRQDNMYSFDMKNIVPKDGLTCLVAKATSEEINGYGIELGHLTSSSGVSILEASSLALLGKASFDMADVDEHLYRSMIGSLMYLTASRPDIMFAVCACARFQVSLKSSHLLAVKRIFRYLKGKPSLGLWYSKDSPLELVAYTDSDYAGATQDRKSTTGGCQFLGNRLISWQCKKQTVVATSTTEAEYVAAASCCGQVLWIQNQLLDYGYNFMDIVIYIDNTSTICIIENHVQHSKTKHIEIRHHFIRDCNAKKLIQMAKIDTQHNVADLLTKGFDAGRFQYLVSSIGMLNP